MHEKSAGTRTRRGQPVWVDPSPFLRHNGPNTMTGHCFERAVGKASIRQTDRQTIESVSHIPVHIVYSRNEPPTPRTITTDKSKRTVHMHGSDENT